MSEYSRFISKGEKVTIATVIFNNSLPIFSIPIIYKVTDNDITLILEEVHNNSNLLIFKKKEK